MTSAHCVRGSVVSVTVVRFNESGMKVKDSFDIVTMSALLPDDFGRDERVPIKGS